MAEAERPLLAAHRATPTATAKHCTNITPAQMCNTELYKVEWHTIVGKLPPGAMEEKKNEDALSLNTTTDVFGVYDGNGKTKSLLLQMLGITEEEWGLAALEMGIEYDIKTQFDPNEVSHFLSDNLPSTFDQLKGVSNKSHTKRKLRKLMKRVHREIRDNCMMGSGSTAVLAKLTLNVDKIIVANCGDSRAVLCREGKAVQLSQDSNADKNFGSSEFSKKHIYVREEVFCPETDEFLVLMSDGVYNAFAEGNDGVAHFVQQQLLEDTDPTDNSNLTKNNIAVQLVQEARRMEELKSSPDSKIDDMTAIVIQFHPHKIIRRRRAAAEPSRLHNNNNDNGTGGSTVIAVNSNGDDDALSYNGHRSSGQQVGLGSVFQCFYAPRCLVMVVACMTAVCVALGLVYLTHRDSRNTK